ncbi:hypothetical protein B0T22DRAFT_202404 [Podospora appendiculata]|uniref:Developmental regulatory protein wetA n=1 Tax=Podospora appendiculata TaxID=314037 RepID=A0AAE0X442_9PEZI|nr:hypothetical protein B0T22DRAFT_202404 [Podospora appendiculata]
MASSVQGMAFTASELSLENKGGDPFYWQDAGDDTGSADFFDQFVMLDGAEPVSPTGGEEGGSFEPLCGTGDSLFSPPAAESLADPVPPSAGSSDGRTNQDESLSTARFPRSQKQHQHQHQHQHRQLRGGASMAMHHHPDSIGRDELLFGYHDAPGGGSISDSELLRLEGLTMRSPRVQVPPVSASVPPSPHSQQGSPRKTGRIEAFCNKIRNKTAATLQGRSKQLQPPRPISGPIISTAKMGSGPGPLKTEKGRPRSYNLQVTKPNLPLSPPLTGSLSDISHQLPVTGTSTTNTNNGMAFVNGFLDDPFLEPSALLLHPSPHQQQPQPQQQQQAQPNGNRTVPSTPLQTPLLSGFPSTPGGTVNAAWPFGTTPDDKNVWTLPMTSTPSGLNAATWWPADDMDTADDMTARDITGDLSFQPTPNTRNSSFHPLFLQHLQNQQQQQHLRSQQQQTFEYPAPPSQDDFSTNGLMIHMPQPRGPAPEILYHQQQQHFQTANGSRHMRTRSEHYQQHQQQQQMQAQQQQQQQQQQQSQQRRSKPRAPSSGARYHHHQPSGAMISPRKQRNVSGSGSGIQVPPSPSPTPRSSSNGVSKDSMSTSDGGSGGARRQLHRRSVSMQMLSTSTTDAAAGPVSNAAIRKRRSWTGRRPGSDASAAATAAPATLSHASRRASSSSLNTRAAAAAAAVGLLPNLPNPSPARPTRHSSLGTTTDSASKPKQQKVQLSSFVNYTPHDHDVLMTGVAPSGSSKTKARREKEALDRQRKLSEAMLRAVTAAGGDVRKLEEGIMLNV